MSRLSVEHKNCIALLAFYFCGRIVGESVVEPVLRVLVAVAAALLAVVVSRRMATPTPAYARLADAAQKDGAAFRAQLAEVTAERDAMREAFKGSQALHDERDRIERARLRDLSAKPRAVDAREQFDADGVEIKRLGEAVFDGVFKRTELCADCHLGVMAAGRCGNCGATA